MIDSICILDSMTLNLSNQNDEAKLNIARENASKLLTLFPEFGDFRMSEIIEQKFEVGTEDREKLMGCITQIDRVLRDKGYIETARLNQRVILTPKGRMIRQSNLDIMNKVESFTSQCDSVLRFITSKENKNKAYSSKEISEIVDIDVDTIELIAKKLFERNLILLSSTNGYSNFHVLPAAEIFVRETSFEEEKKKTFVPTNVTNIHLSGQGHFVTLGSIVNSVITNSVKISEQGNGDIATALESLAKAVADARDIAEEDKKEYLEQINTLSEQALLPEDQRLPKSTLKPIINYSLSALSAIASVAGIWDTWGVHIKAFFIPGS